MIVAACSTLRLTGFTVSEAKTEMMRLQIKCAGKGVLHHQYSRPDIQKPIEFVHSGGAITPVDREFSVHKTGRLQRAWACFQQYKMEIYDRLGVSYG